MGFNSVFKGLIYQYWVQEFRQYFRRIDFCHIMRFLESEEVAKAAHKKTDPSSLFVHSFYYSVFNITLKVLLFLRISRVPVFLVWGRAVCSNKSKKCPDNVIRI